MPRNPKDTERRPVFVVDGHDYEFEDLTLDELAGLELEFMCNMGELLISGNAHQGRAILAAFWARTLGADAARVKVGAMTLREYYEATPIRGVDDPKAGPTTAENPPA